jgi:16S rRNA (uracil1498-N3)-methyltransferase
MPRVYLDAPFALNEKVPLEEKHFHYLVHVMRVQKGEKVLAFNGRQGLWEGVLTFEGKKQASLQMISLLEEQPRQEGQDAWLLFAPIKKEPMDWMIQKATELGVSKMIPVLTERTNASRLNLDRFRLIATEASEQSERLTIPEITPAIGLEDLLKKWDESRTLCYLNERGKKHFLPPIEKKAAFFIGPEGGFAPRELKWLSAFDFAVPLNLGERILRAETAALSVLSIWNFYHLSAD